MQAFFRTAAKATFGLTISNLSILAIDASSAVAPWKRWWWRYALSDAMASALAWSVLFAFRKGVVEPGRYGVAVDMAPDANFWAALCLVPMFWWVLHASMGMYSDIRRRHRGLEIQQVFQGSAVGGVLLFFALLLEKVKKLRYMVGQQMEYGNKKKKKEMTLK